MNLATRINAFAQLGERIRERGNEWDDVLKGIFHRNGWFEKQQLDYALDHWGRILTAEQLYHWTNNYSFSEATNKKRVGVIMAGNIPMVGLHDLLCVLLSGHSAVAKLSSDDDVLIPFLFQHLVAIEPDFAAQFEWVQRIKEVDLIIATGSDNTSRYFEYYFGKYPNIIRKNRTSVAVLSGNESKEDLIQLSKDIFTYYGLGCRNVTKLLVPKGYNFDQLFEAFLSTSEVMENKKYMNNYEYHKTLFLMNNEPLLDNGFVILKEDTNLHSPLGVIHYEYYDENTEKLIAEYNASDQVQCTVGKGGIHFGTTQKPELESYADGVDTMQFLLNS